MQIKHVDVVVVLAFNYKEKLVVSIILLAIAAIVGSFCIINENGE